MKTFQYLSVILFVTTLIISCSNPKLPDVFLGTYSDGDIEITLNKDGTFVEYEGRNKHKGTYEIIESDGSSSYDWTFTIKLNLTSKTDKITKGVFELYEIEVHIAGKSKQPVLRLYCPPNLYWYLDKK